MVWVSPGRWFTRHDTTLQVGSLSGGVLLFLVPLSEKAVISRLRKIAQPSSDTVAHGIGDDCAILRPKAGQELLVTTDYSLEGTHFRREWHPAKSVGHRCLCRGLSDIAAMGGEPVAAFLSLGLPKRLPQNWVDEFMRGFLRLAARYKVQLAGGDTAESRGGVQADVVVVGSVPTGRSVLRSGARVGDVVYVTGSLGGASATLKRLYSGSRVKPRSAPEHFFPEPRLAVAKFIREKKLATSMIDVSDGLSTDLAHICEASGVGAVVNQLLLPLGRAATIKDALHGGEDYELLFTARKSTKVPVEIAGISVTEIGWITKEKRLRITDCTKPARRLEVKGWEHFRK
jgi:thiamine-monophosphate kinase